jgi:uncharacterized protein
LRTRCDEVTALVRRTPRPGEAAWDPPAGSIDADTIEGADAVVHLAGAGIGDKRWSAARRHEIVSSRVQSTALLARTLAELSRRPAVLVSASAVGYYGDRGDEELTEDSEPGSGFLADVCRAWEGAAAPAVAAGVRVVALRSGVVLSAHGGALTRQLPLFRAGVGGRLGSGRQWCDFTRALGRALHRPAVLAVPGAALRVALGSDFASEMVLAGQRVLPAKLMATGYTFAHPGIESALASVVGASR